ncbi:hypothetical protein HWV62_13968 [Athelia sp. TMB]|nr:hypothetical protein HWV62_13968 [Athelia sp. TMB]
MRPITYGRKSSKRHVENTQKASSKSLDVRPSKRSKTVVETTEPIATDDEEMYETKTENIVERSALLSNATPESETRTAFPLTPHKTKPTHLPGTPSSSTAKLTAAPTLPADDLSIQYTSTPSTPTKPAKDLSRIFDIGSATKGLNTVTHSGSGSGLAKRMLSRSRTESSLESMTASPAALKAPHLESLKNVDPPARRSPSRSPSPTTVVPMPAMPVTRTRTYAGKSRSFLIPIPTSQIPALSQSGLNIETEEDSHDEFEIRESYTDLRTRWGVDNSEDDPRPIQNDSRSPSPSGSRAKSPGKLAKGKGKSQGPIVYANGLTNDLKSITELRSKGESRRFLDEVGYLFEGLEPNSGPSIRRASALEIVTKLCSSEFARKAKAADLHIRIWDELISAGALEDKILASILSFFVALMARDSSSLQELANNSKGLDGDIVETLLCLLHSTSGTGLSISEREKDPLAIIGAGVSDAELRKFGVARTEKASISNRLLLSHALCAFPPSTLSPSQITTILASLRSELALIPPRLSAYSTGLPLLPPPSSNSHLDTPSFPHIENCLRLVDSFVLGQWNTDAQMNGKLAAKNVLELSRSNGLADDLVAMCVAIELLADNSKGDKSIVISVDCIGKRNCIIACECSDRVSALDCLARIYVQLRNGKTDPGSDFLRGHLAVLFGLLMRDSPGNQKKLLAALPGSTDHTKISDLAQQAGEFVGFYARLTARLNVAIGNSDDGEQEGQNSDPASEDIGMERIGRNGNGHIAQEVVTFLQKLSVEIGS